MAEESVKPLVQQTANDGSVVATTRLTPVEDKVRGSMVVPPTTVVPVIFVPGIMGSNLRDKKTKESVWNVNSTVSILLQWVFRSAKTRQSKLRADDAEVDPSGKWYGKSATVPDKSTGHQRGQGSTSKASYGDFVCWLDDKLSGLTGGIAQGASSPWSEMVDQGIGQWSPERTPQALTQSNADFAWDNFYCPVHVVGYNWLQSNGESGKYLAEKITEIIAEWNGRGSAGGPAFRCEQVILISHSMGGLVTRAAVHSAFGSAADKVLGIVHGEQPANGAAAAYHHCRSGYGGISGWVLGRNAAQVTAVFANSPGAMELLPNHQYPTGWLKARVGSDSAAILELPKADPYIEIYLQREPWWRLVDPAMIDPSKSLNDPWFSYRGGVNKASQFHYTLGTTYHPRTYVHYGADEKAYPAYGDLIWCSTAASNPDPTALLAATPVDGSDPVTIRVGKKMEFSIAGPKGLGYPQPGDGTVPACSGEAPHTQGGGNIKQSFRLSGFEHQGSYNNDAVRQTTFYSICMLLQEAKVL